MVVSDISRVLYSFPIGLLYIVPDWLATSKMIKKLHNALFPGDDIDFFNENSDNVTFSKDEMEILSVVLSNINLDDINFDEDDPETIIHVRLMA